MSLYKRLENFVKIIKNEFADILKTDPVILETKIRFFLKDNSFIEIRYPLETDYSFHWQRHNEVFRINTAPDHRNIKTFPRHIHRGSKIYEDEITDLKLSPEENLRNFLKAVKEEIKRSTAR